MNLRSAWSFSCKLGRSISISSNNDFDAEVDFNYDAWRAKLSNLLIIFNFRATDDDSISDCWLTCRSTSRRCSFTQFLNVFAWISTHRSSLPRIFMPLAAVPSGDLTMEMVVDVMLVKLHQAEPLENVMTHLATRPACVIFCISVDPSALCCNNPLWVILAPFGRSIVQLHFEFEP